ncbi:hypothetical protein GCM10025858_37280 [Alicyclobacillus sacchari]|nr:hypothetical protein GCM10025858_37280 [Alicyclobacillus sacchari]
MRLRQLVQPFLNYQITGAENPDILHIVTDSRQAAPGALFAAIPGHTVDGHAFAAQAVEQGQWHSWSNGASRVFERMCHR